jgi:cysteinyl-tRNA synthetase
MEIRLHNTYSGRKEVFRPLDPDRVTMYVCGPTVYGYVHIGNGRPAVVFDVLFRVLRACYRDVRYARNVTDVDDKINAAARERGEPIAALTERFTAAYNEDVKALGNLDPTVEPRATHHIAEIVAMIETLVARGHAYAADGHVLFHVPSDPAYGRLSKRSLEDMLDGARVEVAPYKRDPKDFVLWKPSPPELPGWDSPWGRGRPGWHIECSAMIGKHLGPTIDIHGGGSDLTFPHHENELAQGRCAAPGNAYVRYWLHNGMLTLGTEKMSKSLGNIRTIRDLLQEHSGEVLRYALLSGQYRSPLAWSDDLLKQAKTSLDRLYQALRETPAGNAQHPEAFANERIDAFPAAVVDALADDLNTPGALAALHGFATEMHRANDPEKARALRDDLLAGGWLLGLLEQSPEDYFRAGSRVEPAEIETLIAERNAARKARDFARADAIRQALLARGIELEDTRDGTRWKVIERSS